MGNMFMSDIFIYLRKSTEKGDGPVITNRGSVAFFTDRALMPSFHSAGNISMEKLKLKTNFSKWAKIIKVIPKNKTRDTIQSSRFC
jgi:hypothetical protein